MCLPVSRLFWVSSLAYPNLLGTKDYVVVVVVDQYDPSIIYLIFQLPALTHFLEAACAKVS
jgi:hypothetical protein